MNEGIQRILLATDGSADSKKAAALAASLAGALKAGVTVLHVAPNAGLPLGTTQLGSDSPEPSPEDEVDMVKAIWEGSQVILDDSTAPFDRLGVAVEGLVQEGNVAEEILQLANEGFDLLVLGRHGTGGSDDELGSTAAAIMRNAPCSVLLVGSSRKTN